jgi:cytochrome oxidase Cu insertion factor (SCO1/SenC/PrrC family)
MALKAASEENDATPTIDNVPANRTAGEVKFSNIPDTMVLDQEGRQVHFYRDLVKGRTVAINFIFTTCTTICPPLTATFRKVQQELGEQAGRDVQLISISVDPTIDIPERLKGFAAKFGAGPGWTFVTGSKSEIDELLKALGGATPDKAGHSPMVLIGNDEARYWTRTYGLAPAATLVKTIREALSKSASAESDASVPLPGGSETRIEKRVVTASAATSPTSNRTPVKAPYSRKKTPAEAAAAYFPNTVLLTQYNKPVHFFDDLLKGKTVLINFAFTTCTGVCPPMTANLAKVQEYLGDRVGRDILMITISVDPVTDTPEALRKYADKFKVKPGWYFLTGRKPDVDQVLYKIGGYVTDKNDHSAILIIGNAETGQWSKLFAMTRPNEIVDAVIKVAGVGKQ